MSRRAIIRRAKVRRVQQKRLIFWEEPKYTKEQLEEAFQALRHSYLGREQYVVISPQLQKLMKKLNVSITGIDVVMAYSV